MTTFRVWAPDASGVEVEVAGERHELRRVGEWWEQYVAGCGHGDDYAFRVDGGQPRPDPRSRWQPNGVHAPSRLYDHGQFAWTDGDWTGRPLAGGVIYELHVGTFTTEGTFDAAAERLGHLVELGVDFVEVLPVAAFDGPHGWGYDGVDLFAVHEPYGGPDGFKRFVSACHSVGLGVILDVVYNHVGPSGNYLAEFGRYFTTRYRTPWGPAINYDGPGSDEVRRWVIDNALMWLRDYHVDGLRLDAVHAIVDIRATHILEELAQSVEVAATELGRPLFLVAESDQNDPRLVASRDAGGFGLDAQWADDVHHGLHAHLTGERAGYYVDFGGIAGVAKALTTPFVQDGTWSQFRRRHHGRPLDRVRTPGHRFVTYLQNHDQVGNRAGGDRLTASLSPGLVMVGAALVLTSPYTPLLFMGEEWGASTPWQFFSSFPDPSLGAAVRDGRRGEFARFGWRAEEVPDPQDPDTMLRSRLDWLELDKEPHREMLDWYKRLIALRKSHPSLLDPRLDQVRVRHDENWLVVYRGQLAIVANLAAQRQTVPLEGTPRGVPLASASGFVFRPGEVDLDAESVAVVALV